MQKSYLILKRCSTQEKKAAINENQQLLRPPIVRNGRKATVGYQPDVWKDWE